MGNQTEVVSHLPDPDRVRDKTRTDVNARIDYQARERLRELTSRAETDDHLYRLDREWDFERLVETEFATTALAGLVLALAVDRRFLVIPGFATAMMLVHALGGWYPLLPLLRRLGIRTQNEIDRERFAVKALRGDFTGLKDAESDRRAELAWRAAHI